MTETSIDRATALRRCWHPVACGAEVGAAPRAAALLGQPLVLWRDSRGAVHAFDDLCVHRGTALSLGSVRGDELVCVYHGWRYGADGACTFIPQLPEPTRVPARARATAHRCCERYGLVWVGLEAPRWPLPEVPELEDPAWRVVATGPFAWRCEASRQVENFTDFGHFAFVHPGLLGDPAQPVVAPYEVRVDGHVLRYEYTRPDTKNTADFPVYAEAGRDAERRVTSYALHLPYTIVEHIDWGARERMVYFFASQPVALDRCIGYCLVARNYNLDQPDGVMQEFERAIFAQDQRVVESQRPAAVPFDLGAELHLRFDAVAVAYRRAMQANGLA
ncbi:MAG TPA: aromatic ring-hydroxylating dioxygenase subunit alpha [Methylomirabilota bacterium]|nr:aromatic ring-hydroxylating dioxygenase subunit alpha [Methylomirabilota bacterium]